MERVKKLPISISQYTIADSHKVAGGQGGTLVKGKVAYGEYKQLRLSTEIKYTLNLPEQDNKTAEGKRESLVNQSRAFAQQNQSRQDFQKIFELCGGNSFSKIAYGLRGYEGAGVAMISLLLELNTLNKAARSCAKKNPNYDIAVFRTGGSLFDNESYDEGTIYAIAIEPASEAAQLQAIKTFTAKYIIGKTKRVSMVKIVPKGSKPNWSMSAKDYAAMYKRASKINEIVLRN